MKSRVMMGMAGMMVVALGLGLAGCRKVEKGPVQTEETGEAAAEPKPAETKGGYETIDEAIARGELEEVRRQITEDPKKIHEGKNPGMSPLLQSVLRSKDEIALVLLEAGADPNKRDQSDRTALHLAVERGNAALVPRLIAYKADPNLLDKTGWTPLHWAAAKDKLEVAKALLDGGADVKVLSAAGGTALHEGAASGGEAMIQLLLERGVDPTVVSKTGVTALDVAKEMKNEAAIKVLGAL